ncbi:TLC domain-containing protein [Fimicolochytrium jonesii]|uniref:TLC domain-containing protein n=1 Tax=Fimicolochytrium jonesii TaxID=1396493 RepID=UPI0022FF0CAA|nr:TLC domain-containing protein [Fimicolochytrium jonesii]KAI8819884.1 TLC domain-containing protein [Fimicolochytrium jonesii]
MSSESASLPLEQLGLLNSNQQVSLPQALLRMLNYNHQTGLCQKGWNDITLALIFATCFLLVKGYLYKAVFPPIADRMGLPQSRITRAKFSEQFWLMLCHFFSFTFGALLLIGRDYGSAAIGKREGLKHFWVGYPFDYKYLDPVFKLYYMGVIGYWFHHCAALAIESYQRSAVEKAKAHGKKTKYAVPKRSDFYALAVHHFVTVSLLSMSYYMNFTRVGHVVLVLLDLADVILPFAKIMRYAGQKTICDVSFAVFTVSWVLTRHYYLFHICLSIWRDTLIYIPEQSRHWDPWGAECFYSFKVYYMFLGLFCALQVLLLYWLALILKVVLKVISGAGAEDVRSDNEEDEEVDETSATAKTAPRKEGERKQKTKPSLAGQQARRTAAKMAFSQGASGLADGLAVREGDVRRRR